MYIIKGKPQNGKWEEIDTATTEREATQLVKEYQMAFGNSWSIKATKRGGGKEQNEVVNEGYI